jgi:hypothetical protein
MKSLILLVVMTFLTSCGRDAFSTSAEQDNCALGIVITNPGISASSLAERNVLGNYNSCAMSVQQFTTSVARLLESGRLIVKNGVLTVPNAPN